jgi:D-sedoheptulose 7-phosphate isomerase
MSNLQNLIDLLNNEKSKIESFLSQVQPQGIIYTAGNGGSAAEAAHLTEELLGKYEKVRRPIQSMCFCSDAFVLSCISNDFGYNRAFSRLVEAFVWEDDTLVLFTTSGNSDNIYEALLAGVEKNATIILLNGKDGGKCHKFLAEKKPEKCYELLISSTSSARIQEAHQFVMHELVEKIEKYAA